MANDRKLISIVIPVFNEEANIEPLYAALNPVLDQLKAQYDFELLFTDNHSTDGTFDILRRLSLKDMRLRVLRFSRNFGFQRSIYTGYIHAQGDAAVQIDCDLQDPPEMILEFVKKWEEGYQVVYGERSKRQESWTMNVIRKIFYRLIDLLSEDELPYDAGDFRLVDRRVLDVLKQIDDYQPYLRGTIATLGFNQIGIPYNRNERKLGVSKFSMAQLLGLALDGILNHSVVPLRLATAIGFIVSVTTFMGTAVYLLGKIVLGKPWPPGFTTLVVLILGSLSLNALFLGIIGEYLGRIYRQVKKRPLTIIECEINSISTLPAENPAESWK
jgi:glycosyltransferase involved in cell wall biosynthesis